MTDDRDLIQQRERGRATVRAMYLSEFLDVKKRRSAALKEAEEQLDRLASILPSAIDAGLTVSEIAVAAEVSRPTVYQLRARYTESGYGLNLALLQSIANLGRVERSELLELVGGDAERISAVIESLLEESLVDEEFNDDGQNPAMELGLTPAGLDALERWDFGSIAIDREGPE